MLERQLEYERVRLEAESRKACLESQEKVRVHVAATIVVYGHKFFSTGETKSTVGQFPVTESHSLSTVKQWKSGMYTKTWHINFLPGMVVPGNHGIASPLLLGNVHTNVLPDLP
jgi:hypothetical protein